MLDFVLLHLSITAVHAISLFIQSAIVLSIGLYANKKLVDQGPFVQSYILRSSVASALILALLSLFAPSPVPSLWQHTAPSYRLVSAPVFASAIIPQDDRDISPVSNTQARRAEKDVARGKAQGDPLLTGTTQPKNTEPQENISSVDWQAIAYDLFASVWLAGILCLFVWMILGRLALAKLFRSSRLATSCFVRETVERVCQTSRTRQIPVYESKSISGPFLCGIIRPSILLPQNFGDGLAPEQLEAVIAHEIAHTRRNDNAWRFIGQLVASILWFQPLIWKTLHEMDAVFERSCDQLVVDSGCEPLSYADTLLTLAQFPSPRPIEQSFGTGAVPLKSRLSARIEELAKLKSIALGPSSPFKQQLVISMIGIVALVFVLFAVRQINLFPESWATNLYLSNFALPEKLGYDMGPVRHITSPVSNSGVSADSLFPIYYLSNNEKKFLEKVGNSRLSYFTRMYPAASLAEFQAARKMLKESDSKTRCFVETLIANYYFLAEDRQKENEYRIQALRDAPVVLAGRVVFDDGAPAVGLPVTFMVVWYKTPFDKQNEGAEKFNNIVTDQNGCYYIPSIPAYTECYPLLDQTSLKNAGNQPLTESAKRGLDSALAPVSFDNCDQHDNMFRSDRKVGILPPIIAHPFVKLSPDYLNGLSHRLEPVPIIGDKLTVSWTPASHAISYKVALIGVRNFFYEPDSHSGEYSKMIDVDHDPRFSYIPADKRSVTFDLKAKDTPFLKGQRWSVNIIAYDAKGNQWDVCPESEFIFSDPPVPLGLTQEQILQRLPKGSSISKIENYGYEVTIRGQCPRTANMVEVAKRLPVPIKLTSVYQSTFGTTPLVYYNITYGSDGLAFPLRRSRLRGQVLKPRPQHDLWVASQSTASVKNKTP